MSTIKVCDGCGAQSPNKKGLFVENHWIEINAQWRGPLGYPRSEQLIYCPTCVSAGLLAMTSALAKRLQKEMSELKEKIND